VPQAQTDVAGWWRIPSVLRLAVAQWASAGMLVWPVMTLFLQARGLSFTQIGVMSSVGALVSLVVEIPSGWLADRWGRRRTLTLGAVVLLVAMAALLTGTEFARFVVIEALFSVGLGLLSGADTASLYDAVTRHHRDYVHVTSRISVVSQVLRFCARLAAPAVLAASVLAPVAASAALYAVSIVAFATLGRDVEPDATRPHESAPDKPRWHWLHGYGGFVATAVVGSVMLEVFSSFAQYVGPFLVDGGLTLTAVGPVLAIAGLTGLAGSWVAPALRRHLGGTSLPVLLGLGAAIAVLVATAPLTAHWLWRALPYAAMCFAWSIFLVLLMARLNGLVDSRYRATALSVAAMFDAVAAIAGDPLIGWGIDRFGFQGTYLTLGLGTLAVLALSTAAVAARRRPS
jgi:predicted MFS family arabinose efflux permease